MLRREHGHLFIKGDGVVLVNVLGDNEGLT
jgi:hypothetical protein